MQLTDDLRYKLLKALEECPGASQRELSKVLGVSLGKTNFCIQALLKIGWIKVNNFKNSQNKLAYSYMLTPRGLDEKINVTKRFLRYKLEEYEKLDREIKFLQKECFWLESSQATDMHN